MTKVYVTGIGVISAIGRNTGENFASLINGESGVGFESSEFTGIQGEYPIGRIRLSNEELFEYAQMRKRSAYSRTALLGIIAAGESFKSSGLDSSNGNIALISGTSVGGMDQTEKHYYELLSKKENSVFISAHDCGDSTEKIAAALGISGTLRTISTACSSAANAIMLGARCIKNGRLERVIAGGTDALASFTLKGFNSLMILSKNRCRPFDDNRDGINLGEGAGYIVLESEESVSARGSRPLCELKGFGNSCDAFHQTAMSADGNGPFKAMSDALRTAEISPADIHYINAHGTGTINNDLSEYNALKRVFYSVIPEFSSTKPYTGHCLGASGGIEAVFSILAIINKVKFANLNFQKSMKEADNFPVRETVMNLRVDNVISNSFGFGGNNTSLVFSSVDSSGGF